MGSEARRAVNSRSYRYTKGRSSRLCPRGREPRSRERATAHTVNDPKAFRQQIRSQRVLQRPDTRIQPPAQTTLLLPFRDGAKRYQRYEKSVQHSGLPAIGKLSSYFREVVDAETNLSGTSHCIQRQLPRHVAWNPEQMRADDAYVGAMPVSKRQEQNRLSSG